jgi:hypothetical protein
LVNQLFEGLSQREVDERLFDLGIEAFVEHRHRRIVCEVQGHDAFLEFGSVGCNGLGLLESAEAVLGLLFKIAIRIHRIEGLLECLEVFEIRVLGILVLGILENAVRPFSWGSAKVRNNE